MEIAFHGALLYPSLYKNSDKPHDNTGILYKKSKFTPYYIGVVFIN